MIPWKDEKTWKGIGLDDYWSHLIKPCFKAWTVPGFFHEIRVVILSIDQDSFDVQTYSDTETERFLINTSDRSDCFLLIVTSMPPSPKIQIPQVSPKGQRGCLILLALSSAQPEKPEKNWLACFKYDHRVPSCMLMPAKPPQCFLSRVVTKPDYEDAMRSLPWESQPHSQADQAIPAKPLWPLSGCHLY